MAGGGGKRGAGQRNGVKKKNALEKARKQQQPFGCATVDDLSFPSLFPAAPDVVVVVVVRATFWVGLFIGTTWGWAAALLGFSRPPKYGKSMWKRESQQRRRGGTYSGYSNELT